MKYYFGIDGGGTKTQCYIGDEIGNVLGQGIGGRCNYQTYGINTTKESINQAFQESLLQSGLRKEQICFGVLGLSGADEPRDFKVLNKLCEEVFGSIKHKIVNDTWIGLRTGARAGVVSICGTGAAHAGVNELNEHEILRNLDFEIGNRGGGSEIFSNALHYAFRSNEGTYTKTKLEDVVIDIFNVKTMDDVCDLIREDKITDEMYYNIPVKTLELATLGDLVATEIITEMGYTEGLYASAIIKKLHMEDREVPMVLIGGIFKTNHKILIDSYMEAVHKTAPKAYAIIPNDPPVIGALLLAIEEGVN